MSQENVEIVRRYLESFPAVEQAVEFWEVDGDYYPLRKFPEARPCHGREEIAGFFTELFAAWGGFGFVINDAKAVGDDRALAHARLEAQGRASGITLEGDMYYSFWLRHGRLIRQEDHRTAKRALHALGLGGETLEAAGLRE